MDKRTAPVRHLDSVDGTVYGKHNKVKMVNPYLCYFIVTYGDGSVYSGNDLFTTGWDGVRQGIKTLQYKLSTGHIINIPKFKGYLPTIEVSESIEGFKMFHAINVNCLGFEEVVTYRIILKEDRISKYKIGDIIISKSKKNIKSSQWRMSS